MAKFKVEQKKKVPKTKMAPSKRIRRLRSKQPHIEKGDELILILGHYERLKNTESHGDEVLSYVFYNEKIRQCSAYWHILEELKLLDGWKTEIEMGKRTKTVATKVVHVDIMPSSHNMCISTNAPNILDEAFDELMTAGIQSIALLIEEMETLGVRIRNILAWGKGNKGARILTSELQEMKAIHARLVCHPCNLYTKGSGARTSWGNLQQWDLALLNIWTFQPRFMRVP